ncbi:MAG TPA: chromate resistance protein ChrB [Thermoanaerobacterales bacterium]|nr:chromate resistance protein ChrB [Thermoanaerobacterales bacterium]
MSEKLKWFLIIYRVPSEPSTLRVKAWRKLKELGALYLQQSAAIYPCINNLEDEIRILTKDIKESGGEALLLQVTALSDEDENYLISKFNEQRDLEYEELMDKCNDFYSEIEKETAKQNFTFAELEENDEEIDKLSRWFSKIRERDFFGSKKRQKAEEMMAGCRKLLMEFADKIYKKEGTI